MPIELTHGVTAPGLSAEERQELERSQDRADAEQEKLRAAQLEEERIVQEGRVREKKTDSDIEEQLRLLARSSGVKLMIHRTQSKPRNSLHVGHMDTIDFEDVEGSVEDYLRTNFGGGKYRVVPRDRQNSPIAGKTMTYDIAGKSKLSEDKEEAEPSVAAQLKDVLPLLQSNDKTAEIFEHMSEQNQALLLSVIAKGSEDKGGIREVVEAMREDRRAADEREARREERKAERMSNLLTTALSLLPAGLEALRGLMDRAGGSHERAFEMMAKASESSMELATKSQSYIMKRFVDMLGQTAQTDEEQGLIGKAQKIIGMLGSPQLAGLGDILKKGVSPRPATARVPAPTPLQKIGSTELQPGEDHESVPLGIAPPEQPAPPPAPLEGEQMLGQITPETVALVRRSRVDQFLGVILVESQLGTDPEGAAISALEHYKLLPGSVVRVIEQTEEITDLGKVMTALREACTEKVLDALVNEVATAPDPQEKTEWLWNVLGELLNLSNPEEEEEGDDEEAPEDDEGVEGVAPEDEGEEEEAPAGEVIDA